MEIGPFIANIDAKLDIPDITDEYILYRAEGENSIDGLHISTLYIYSNQPKNPGPITLTGLKNKLITVELDIDLASNTTKKYDDIVIAGYARSVESFLIPTDLGTRTTKSQDILYFYKIELVSNYWWLTQDENNYVYTKEEGVTVEETLTDVLKKSGLPEADYDLSMITQPTATAVKHHCFVQYRESTHEFIRRLMLVGNIFAYDGFKDEGKKKKPCRFFVDNNNQYTAYGKYQNQAILHDFEYQLPTFKLENYRTMDDNVPNKAGSGQSGYIRQPATYWIDKPYKSKHFSFYMRSVREEVNVTKVNGYQYNPDNFEHEIAGPTGQKNEDVGFSREYYVYSQGTTSGDCKNQSQGLLNRLKSNTFIHLHSTIPVTLVGCTIGINSGSKYQKDSDGDVKTKYVVYKTKYVIGYPAHSHVLYANSDKYYSDSEYKLWDTDDYEFNFELTCLPEKNYPPLVRDVSESPAVGRFLDALVVSEKGKIEAPTATKVSTNDMGDVYVGLFLEYEAQKEKYKTFTAVRTKMNITNGNTTPMVNTPAAVMIQEFGKMFVYCGQRHDDVNKPLYPAGDKDYFQRHDKTPPAVDKQLCIVFDNTQGKETLTSLSAFDIVTTAQNNIAYTATKGTYTVKAKGAMTFTAEDTYTVDATKAMKITASDTYTLEVTAALKVTAKADYTVSATGPMKFAGEATYTVSVPDGPGTFKFLACNMTAPSGFILKGSQMTMSTPVVNASGIVNAVGLMKCNGMDIV